MSGYPNAKGLERDEALARLAFCYFTGHGPATLQDFAWWSGLTLSDAAATLDFVRTRLAHEKLDSEIYWFPQNEFVATNSMSHVYLLPSYAEYLVGYKNRDSVLGPEHRAHVFSGNMFNPVIVAGGQVKGTWKRSLVKEKAKVTLKPFTSLGRNPERALTRVVASYGHFLGVRAEMPGA